MVDGTRQYRQEKSQALVKEFDGYTVADGLKVTGQLTLRENIADLGGASLPTMCTSFVLQRLGTKILTVPNIAYFVHLELSDAENTH